MCVHGDMEFCLGCGTGQKRKSISSDSRTPPPTREDVFSVWSTLTKEVLGHQALSLHDAFPDFASSAKFCKNLRFMTTCQISVADSKEKLAVSARRACDLSSIGVLLLLLLLEFQ